MEGIGARRAQNGLFILVIPWMKPPERSAVEDATKMLEQSINVEFKQTVIEPGQQVLLDLVVCLILESQLGDNLLYVLEVHWVKPTRLWPILGAAHLGQLPDLPCALHRHSVRWKTEKCAHLADLSDQVLNQAGE